MPLRKDTFTRANSSSAMGSPSDGLADWIESGCGIISNQAYSPAGGGQGLLDTQSTKSGVLKATFVVAPSGADTYLLWRYIDASNYWLAIFKGDGTGIRMYNQVSGSFSQVGTYGTSLVNGDSVEVDYADASGSYVMTIAVNGVVRITAGDASDNTGTKVGFIIGDSGVRITNFSGGETSWFGTWAKRKPILVGSTKPSSNLTNYPDLVKIVADTDMGSVLSTRKFAVTDVDGATQIPYGNYNDFSVSAGACTATVRYKQNLASAAQTRAVKGYIYYDPTQTDQANRASTFNSNFKLVMPCQEDPSGSAPQIIDWTGGANGTANGGMTSGDLVAGQVASALHFDGSNDYIDVPFTSMFGDAKLTGSFWIKTTGTTAITAFGNFFGGGNSLILIINSDSNSGSDSSGALRFFYRRSGFFDFFFGTNGASSPAINDGAWHHVKFIAEFDITAASIYVDGVVQTGLELNINAGTPDDLTGDQQLGPNASGYAVYLEELQLSFVADSAAWAAYQYQNDKNNSNTVTLGAQETAPATSVPATLGEFDLEIVANGWMGEEFAANALGWFDPDIIDIQLRNLIMQSDAATFAITESTAGLLRSRVFVGGVDTITVTGGSAGLLRGRKLVGSAGTYAVSAGAAFFKRTYQIVGGTGTYTITGGSAGLVRSRVFPASGGSYLVTGGSAVGIRGKNMAVAGGAYSVTAGSAGLLKNKLLVGGTATLTVTGGSATMLRFRLLAGSTAFYTVTGGIAQLFKVGSNVLPADAANFAVTGGSAGLLRSRAFVGSAASYAVTGGSAFGLRGRKLVGGASTYSITGSSVGLLRGRTMLGAGGAYFTAGGSASLQRSRVLVGAASSYSVTGGTATFLRTRVMVGSTALYDVIGGSAFLVFVFPGLPPIRLSTSIRGPLSLSTAVRGPLGGTARVRGALGFSTAIGA